MSEQTEAYIQINELLNEYDFPLEVLKDVKSRLSDSDNEEYALQQVRYLRNVVKTGKARKRGE